MEHVGLDEDVQDGAGALLDLLAGGLVREDVTVAVGPFKLFAEADVVTVRN